MLTLVWMLAPMFKVLFVCYFRIDRDFIVLYEHLAWVVKTDRQTALFDWKSSACSCLPILSVGRTREHARHKTKHPEQKKPLPSFVLSFFPFLSQGWVHYRNMDVQGGRDNRVVQEGKSKICVMMWWMVFFCLTSCLGKRLNNRAYPRGIEGVV